MSVDDKYTYPGSGGVLKNRQGIRNGRELPFVDDHAQQFFEHLSRDDYLRGVDDRSDFSEALAERWGDLTVIHPFRDGNTRSQSLLVSQLTRRAGHAIAWSRVEVERLRDLRLRAINDPRPLAGYLEEVMVDPASLRDEPPHKIAGSSGWSSGVATGPQNQPRRPRGTIGGGRFAPTQRRESDVDLPLDRRSDEES